MWKNYALALYRNLSRRPLYAALNVFGLSVGLATFLALLLVVRHEATFDRWLPGASTIYRVNQIFTLPGRPADPSAASSGVALPLLRTDYPQIKAAARVAPASFPILVDGRVDSQDMQLVDPEFLRVFELPLVSGEVATSLAPGSALITETMARRYFGDTAALGKDFTVNRGGAMVAYRVAGVLKDLPDNSSLNLTILLPITAADQSTLAGFEQWGPAVSYTYLRFASAADAASVSADLDRFVDQRARGVLGPNPTSLLKLRLVALPDLHFADASVHYTPKPGADVRVVASLGVVGALALAIAILNYINLATAQAVLRAREVAIRKVVGASRGALLVQFLAEAFALSLVCGLVALALTELALPLVNALSGLKLKVSYGADGVILPWLSVVLGVGLIAGLYPAWLISRFEPAPVLSSAKAPGGGRMGSRVRNVLVLLQFASAIAFAICTLTVDAQTRFLRNADRGFDRHGLVLVQSADLDPARQPALLDSLSKAPGVVGVTLSDREPASTNIQLLPVSRPGQIGAAPTLTREIVGRDYFSIYGIVAVAGRVFQNERRGDDLAGVRATSAFPGGVNIVVNTTAVKALGLDSPSEAVGKIVQFSAWDGASLSATIIGVVQDVRFMSPKEPVAPIFYLHDSTRIEGGVVAVRYRGIGETEILDGLRAGWMRVAADQPFVARTADSKLGDYFVPDERRARLFGIGAFVAMTLGCVGLFGVASFTSARRIKEVGIRKALGASTFDVVRLMIGQFLQPVLLANFIAWPLAWLVMRVWLAGFDQRIALHPGYFAISSLIALALAVVTVGEQALRVARTAPATALRYE